MQWSHMSPDFLFPVHDADWSITTLGEAAALGGGNVQTGPFGSQLHAADYVEDGIPSVMPQNIGENTLSEDGIARITAEDALRLTKYLLQTGDIVYSRRGDVERRALIREKANGWLCGTGCLRVRFGPGSVDPEYATYYLGHSKVREWIGNNAVGATMPNLNTKILSSVPFVLPPLPEQVRIASILSALDDKIELNRRTNETLEVMAQAIFKDWFVDFGPVHRKMRGETDPTAILGGLITSPSEAATLAALFPDTLGAKGLPEGWSEEPIGDVCDTVGGATPPTKTAEYWEDGKHFWATPKDLSNLSGLYVRTTERTITDEGLARISSGLSPRGSVLMSSRAPIGYVAIASVPAAVNQGFIVLRPTERLPTEYAYFWTKANMDLIESNANGSTFQEISKKNFRPLPVIIPDAEIMLAFVNLTKPMLGRIEQGEIENQTLAETRDYLLPRLMSGQIRAGEPQGMSA